MTVTWLVAAPFVPILVAIELVWADLRDPIAAQLRPPKDSIRPDGVLTTDRTPLVVIVITAIRDHRLALNTVAYALASEP